MKPKYYLENKEFVLENYNFAKPFSSFLPGIAGLRGKPLWAFYVNRGQCMASFGTTSKESAIMEFYPANTAYRRISLEGFRTFIKVDGSVYEPFQLNSRSEQRLYVSGHEFRIEDISRKSSLKTEAAYFTIPQEDFPALARILRIENTSSRARTVEVIDGMPKICPHGMNEFFMKHMSRTIEAWMEVEGVEDRLALYKLRVDAADVAQTKYITSGNFYLSVLKEKGVRPQIIVDPRVVFGDFADFTCAGAFSGDKFIVPKDQVTKNITPSAFSYFKTRLGPKGSITLMSLIGHVESYGKLKVIGRRMGAKFFEEKRELNRIETEGLSSSISVISGAQEFDQYVNQTNLDNILRGGYPINIAGGKKVLYVFNRKHGDLERDYNNFVLRPEFYSQGNGNFRDTNQNRRNSVWLNPRVGSKDIKDFYNLIQLDGYNPLIVKGDVFLLKDDSAKEIIQEGLNSEDRERAREFFSARFTPGELIKFIESLTSPIDKEKLFDDILERSESKVDAEHGEGYWIDHWTYNLDLVESYLALFPEKKEELLFRDKTYMFFDYAHRVKPRKERIRLDHKNRTRQYHSVECDQDKKRLIDSRMTDQSWTRSSHGKGEIYRTSLAAKMLTLIANKIATLDVNGIGVEMEADKPAWCDSLNGLPGLLGSSTSETFELLRNIRFLKDAVEEGEGRSVEVCEELDIFIRGLTEGLEKNLARIDENSNRIYWDRSNELRELYREKVRFGPGGKEAVMGKDGLLRFLSLATLKLEDGIKRSFNKNGVPYTYFTNDEEAHPLPLSLEGPVHAFKIIKDQARLKALYNNIRKSELYDKKLSMYKLNTSLKDESLEIGRARVFTPGWLENESIWLHMEYKLLLELVKAGLYDEFYMDLEDALIPFQDAARYGRSILENSSFIASSEFFDERMRGTGFVARLSGATAEFLNMLLVMNMGNRPFKVSDGKVVFSPSPVLSKKLFTKSPKKVELRLNDKVIDVSIPKDSYAFTVFGETLIIYNNPKKKDTFGKGCVKPVQYKTVYYSGKEAVVKAGSLGEKESVALREGKVQKIEILLG